MSNGIWSERMGIKEDQQCITMMHCDYHSIYPDDKSTNSAQSVERNSSMQNIVSIQIKRWPVSQWCTVTTTASIRNALVPVLIELVASHAAKHNFCSSQGRSVSSITASDRASYDSGHIQFDDQPTPRRRSDTTGGMLYNHQPIKFIILSGVSPRRHSATASESTMTIIVIRAIH